eukprot:s10126_g1.t1
MDEPNFVFPRWWTKRHSEEAYDSEWALLKTWFDEHHAREGCALFAAPPKTRCHDYGWHAANRVGSRPYARASDSGVPDPLWGALVFSCSRSVRTGRSTLNGTCASCITRTGQPGAEADPRLLGRETLDVRQRQQPNCGRKELEALENQPAENKVDEVLEPKPSKLRGLVGAQMTKKSPKQAGNASMRPRTRKAKQPPWTAISGSCRPVHGRSCTPGSARQRSSRMQMRLARR